eukprot:NODE_24_length_36516_cov_0.652470.p1 type:complete len:1168 gc:universal NODE_24_length_36516_cov_0.652470:9695-6192(-)
MGIPKFFRQLSERYPLCSQLITHIPEYDYFYLDMNGLIHMCSHANTTTFKDLPEIISDIFAYLDLLVSKIRPKKCLFLAVDGCAPRSKMNQQRSRRFKAADELQKTNSKSTDPSKPAFDSNCITPGTKFMYQLHLNFQYFIQYKISNDPLWQSFQVIYSGVNVPGEGEHKIQAYIRQLKHSPDYSINLRHCVYGLDADLIMLGLLSHEPHFSLLREEVTFSKSSQSTNIYNQKFFLLHLSLLRDYLDLEFDEVKSCCASMNINYHVNSIIDDYVFLCLFIGNDFLPHLPHFHLQHHALDLIINVYKSNFKGFINVNGKLDLNKVKQLLFHLKDIEIDHFNQHHSDKLYLNSKMAGKSNKGNSITENKPTRDASAYLMVETDSDDTTSSSTSNTSVTSSTSFNNYRCSYYSNKLQLSNPSDPSIVVQDYVIGIQWVILYYYDGVPSWSWYYPHHYSPFIHDIYELASTTNHKFTINTPFTPYQQLLSVMPLKSQYLLPDCISNLMTHPLLSEYYPSEFSVDLNGKQHDWEALVLIPFIDQSVLINCIDEVLHLLTSDELLINEFGTSFMYKFDANINMDIVSTNKDLVSFTSHCAVVSLDIPVQISSIPNNQPHAVIPGFPSLYSIAFDYEFKSCTIRVFNRSTTCITCCITPMAIEKPVQLNSVVLYNWPNSVMGKVVSVDSIDDKPSLSAIYANISSHLSSTFAIFLTSDTLVTVKPFKHVIYSNNRFIQHFDGIDYCPLELINTEFEMDARHIERDSDIEYHVNDQVFVLNDDNYGRIGIIESINDRKATVLLASSMSLSVLNTATADSAQYLQPRAICKRFNISGLLLSKLTSTLKCRYNNRLVNLGLNMKYQARGLKVINKSRMVNDRWEYSSELVEILRQYINKYPDLIGYLDANITSKETLNVDGIKCVPEVIKWVKQYHEEAVPLHYDRMSKEQLKSVAVVTKATAKVENIPLALLMMPEHGQYRMRQQSFKIGDLVVMNKQGLLGITGVVVGIRQQYDVYVPGGEELGCDLDGLLQDKRGYTVEGHEMINLSNRQQAMKETVEKIGLNIWGENKKSNPIRNNKQKIYRGNSKVVESTSYKDKVQTQNNTTRDKSTKGRDRNKLRDDKKSSGSRVRGIYSGNGSAPEDKDVETEKIKPVSGLKRKEEDLKALLGLTRKLD